jgi:hypothetical protein
MGERGAKLREVSYMPYEEPGWQKGRPAKTFEYINKRYFDILAL